MVSNPAIIELMRKVTLASRLKGFSGLPFAWSTLREYSLPSLVLILMMFAAPVYPSSASEGSDHRVTFLMSSMIAGLDTISSWNSSRVAFRFRIPTATQKLRLNFPSNAVWGDE